MYRYICSKQDCGSTWTLHAGRLNGFVLTCPVCGRGRGLFLEQTGTRSEMYGREGVEAIEIKAPMDNVKSLDEFNKTIENFCKSHSLKIVDKNTGAMGGEAVCTLQYIL